MHAPPEMFRNKKRRKQNLVIYAQRYSNYSGKSDHKFFLKKLELDLNGKETHTTFVHLVPLLALSDHCLCLSQPFFHPHPFSVSWTYNFLFWLSHPAPVPPLTAWLISLAFKFLLWHLWPLLNWIQNANFWSGFWLLKCLSLNASFQNASHKLYFMSLFF